MGSGRRYNCDMYNEMDPGSSDTAYLTQAGQVVVQAIQKGNPNGKWLMQGWLFHSPFWSDHSRIKAYATAAPVIGCCAFCVLED